MAIFGNCCLLLALIILILQACGVKSNQAPELRTNRKLVITGSNPTNNDVITNLAARDADGDSFEFSLVSSVPVGVISAIKLEKDGKLTLTDVCKNCTALEQFRIKLKDSSGASRTYTMTVELKDRSAGALSVKSEPIKDNTTSGLLRWHIYLIILCVILIVGVILSLVIYNACTFSPDPYDIPIKRKNRIEDKKSDEKNNDFLYGMNPFARPKKMSLLVRESVRSGAADNSPYYGTRKSGVWIPEAPDSEPGRPQPLRLMSITDQTPTRRESTVPAQSAPQAPPPAAASSARKQSLSQDKAAFSQLSWHDITAPKKY